VDGLLAESYAYDANGNRDPLDAVYDNEDRLRSIDSGGVVYTYDAMAPARRRPRAPGDAYIHRLTGELTEVHLPGAEVVEYKLDGLGRRVEKYVDGLRTRPD